MRRSTPGQVATTLHANCVDLEGRGVLITGASGSGKSGLSLQLMALGARLVADDRTELTARDGALLASCLPAISGMIEARGVGLLRADPVATSVVAIVVDLDTAEAERLPEPRRTVINGVTLPILRKLAAPHFPAAILQYLKAGRIQTQ